MCTSRSFLTTCTLQCDFIQNSRSVCTLAYNHVIPTSTELLFLWIIEHLVVTTVSKKRYYQIASNGEAVSNVNSLSSIAHGFVRTFLVVEASRRKNRGCAFSIACVYRILTLIAAFSAFTPLGRFAPASFHAMSSHAIRSIVEH